MKGLVLYPDNRLQLEEVPEPRLGHNVFAPEDVLIEVALCGICGSDVHHWNAPSLGDLHGPPAPVVTGHEITGTVRAVGPAVKTVHPGDRVVCEIVTFYCGNCINCKTGRPHICVNTPPMEGRAHYVTGGGYAPYVVWPAKHVHRLPDGISFEEAVLLEPTAGSVHTLLERLRLMPGESVAILGPGARGLILAQLALSLGARPVIVSGITRDEVRRLPLARTLGVDAAVNVEREDLLGIVHELTGGIGVDVVVENTGSPTAVAQALDLVRPGGRVMISGGGIRGGITANIDTYKIIVKELDVFGEISHVWTSWNTAIKLVANKRVNLKPLLSDIYPLEAWEEGFREAAGSDRVLRVALSPAGRRESFA